MIQLTDKVYAVDVPAGSSAFKIIPHLVSNAVTGMDAIELVWESERITHSWIILPPGSWRFLFTTKSATEEDARKVVEPVNNPFLKGGNRYRDYTVPQSNTIADAVCNAVQSLHSLLRSEGLDPNKNNYALIEKLSRDE